MRDSIALDSTRLQRLQQISLWDFALSLYAKPGVEAACLSLQDEAEVDVCELLFHCWLYTCGLEVVPVAVVPLRQERRQWQHRVTDVLRELRRDLKASAASSSSIAALRETIKQAELLAERENLQRWQTWIFDMPITDQYVRNIGEIKPNAAIWLRKQLFMTDAEKLTKGDMKRPEKTLHALQTLASQLDPYLGAR
ncbi:MAG TPA: TIGR02444 family protein [Halomonas sp.]|nr:TIGR02444 family protein [Halomonas sp.]